MKRGESVAVIYLSLLVCLALGQGTEGSHTQHYKCNLCQSVVSTRSVVYVVPAWDYCPTGWTLEYSGYLMTEHYRHHRNTFECVDKDPESISGSVGNIDGALFYHVEATCNGLPCPPYDPQKELTCAVCTK